MNQPHSSQFHVPHLDARAVELRGYSIDHGDRLVIGDLNLARVMKMAGLVGLPFQRPANPVPGLLGTVDS